MVTSKQAKAKAAQAITESAERPKVYKGFYIYKDQYNALTQRSATNKINETPPTSSSDIIRDALDEYFARHTV